MNCLHCLTGEGPTPDIRLIGRYDQEKPYFLKKLARLVYARQNFEFAQGSRWIRLPGANQGAVDDAVTIEEDRPAVGRKHIVFGVHSLVETKDRQERPRFASSDTKIEEFEQKVSFCSNLFAFLCEGQPGGTGQIS